MQLRGRFQRKLERALALLLGFAAVCVGACDGELTLPDRSPVNFLLAGHPDGDDEATLACKSNRVVQAVGAADAVKCDIGASKQQRTVHAVQPPRAGRESN